MEEKQKNIRKYVIIGVVAVVMFIVVAVAWQWTQQTETEPISYEPMTYSEVFEDPIDPNTEPERHAEVYEAVSERTQFEVFVPNYIPDGYELTEQETVGVAGDYDKGSFRVTYKNGRDILQLAQLLGDPMPGPEIEVRKTVLTNGTVARSYTFYPKGTETNTMWWVASTEPYYVYSVTSILSEQELVKILNSMQKVP